MLPRKQFSSGVVIFNANMKFNVSVIFSVSCWLLLCFCYVLISRDRFSLQREISSHFNVITPLMLLLFINLALTWSQSYLLMEHVLSLDKLWSLLGGKETISYLKRKQFGNYKVTLCIFTLSIKHLTVLISRLAILSIRRNGIDASTSVISDIVTGSIQETLITWPTMLVLTSALETITARRANCRWKHLKTHQIQTLHLQIFCIWINPLKTWNTFLWW